MEANDPVQGKCCDIFSVTGVPERHVANWNGNDDSPGMDDLIS